MKKRKYLNALNLFLHVYMSSIFDRKQNWNQKKTI